MPAQGQSSADFPRTVFQQSALPRYRENFLRGLVERSGGAITFIVGDEQFGVGVKTDLPPGFAAEHARNHFLAGRRLLWQSGVVGRAVRAPVAILELNPRILSTMFVMLMRWAMRRPTLLWGHAWARSGRASRSNRLRLVIYRMVSGVIVYTDRERDELLAEVPSLTVYAAHNAIYPAAQMQPAGGPGERRDFIYSGRLVAAKKPTLAVRALALVTDPAARLIVIGDGAERPRVEALARELGVADRVEVRGEVFDYAELREAYAGAVAALSPGYVGLSMTQSHAFGLPMIYARDEPHAPEIEAAEDGVNALPVRSDDPEALAAAMNDVLASAQEWRARSDEISAACRERYSAEAMVEAFVTAIRAAAR